MPPLGGGDCGGGGGSDGGGGGGGGSADGGGVVVRGLALTRALVPNHPEVEPLLLISVPRVKPGKWDVL